MAEKSHDEDFASVYRMMPDGKLMAIANEGNLRREAAAAMQEELRARGIGPKQMSRAVREKERAELQRVGRRGTALMHRGPGIVFRGALYLSEADRIDGIQLRTQWLTLCWLGIIPLGSYRVKGHSEGKIVVLSQEPLCWNQVLTQWGITAVVVAVGIIFWQVSGPHLARGRRYW